MGWPSVKLKECCTVVGGATPKRGVPEYWGNDIPWITPKDISNLEQPALEDAPEYISKAGFDSAATYLLPRGSILLTSRAPIGNVAIVGREMCTNQGFKSLVPSDGVDSSYLYHCMKRMAPMLDAIGNGATFKEVSKSVVEGFEIPLPPLKEQKRIAAILDKADAIRRKCQQAIQLADEFLRSVFLDMFGDPAVNPKSWENKCIGDISEKVQDGNYGENYPRSHELLDEGDVPFLTSSSVGENGKIKIDKIRYVTNERNRSLTKVRLKTGDIIFTNRGANFGLSAIVPSFLESGNIGPQLTQITLNKELLLPAILLMILGNHGVNSQLKSINAGSAMNFLGLTATKEFKVICPPIALQREYISIYSKAQENFIRQKNNFDYAKMLFASTIQKAFSGKF